MEWHARTRCGLIRWRAAIRASTRLRPGPDTRALEMHATHNKDDRASAGRLASGTESLTVGTVSGVLSGETERTKQCRHVR